MNTVPRITVEAPVLSIGSGPSDYEGLGRYVRALRRQQGLHLTLLHLGVLEDFARDICEWTKGMTSVAAAAGTTVTWLDGLPVLDDFSGTSERLIPWAGAAFRAWKWTSRSRSTSTRYVSSRPCTSYWTNCWWTTSMTLSSAPAPSVTGPRTGRRTLPSAARRRTAADPGTLNGCRFDSASHGSGIVSCCPAQNAGIVNPRPSRPRPACSNRVNSHRRVIEQNVHVAPF